MRDILMGNIPEYLVPEHKQNITGSATGVLVGGNICTFAPYNIPVLCGFPAGHGDVNLPLIMGAPVTIDVNSTGSTISFGIEGQQKEYHVSSDLKSTKSSVDIRMMLAGKKTFKDEKD